MNCIEIDNLWKEYRLGVISHGTLTKDLQSWWARIRGRQDPNARIDPLLSALEKQIEGDHFWALRGIDLTIKQGDILGIIGKNGAGKSTLLKILSRVTAPSRGSIGVKGRIASLLEVGTGFHPELTGRENIFMNGAILGMSKTEISCKLDEIINFSGVEDFVDTPVKRYSSGMYVRLAFAVAAHLEPEILIIDEVLAVGDAEFQRKCLGKIDDVAHTGRTVLFVSHNMGMINQLCPNTLWMEDGRVRKTGKTEKIISQYLSEATVDVSGGLFEIEADPGKLSQLTKLRILDTSGHLADVFDCDKPIVLELTYTVHKKVQGLYGYLSILKKDQTVVLVSDSFDSGHNNFDDFEPGNHIIVIKIPSRTLAPGDYYVYLNFTGPESQRENIDSPGIVASFSLNDWTTKRGNNRGGYFSTILTWTVSQ